MQRISLLSVLNTHPRLYMPATESDHLAVAQFGLSLMSRTIDEWYEAIPSVDFVVVSHEVHPPAVSL